MIDYKENVTFLYWAYSAQMVQEVFAFTSNYTRQSEAEYKLSQSGVMIIMMLDTGTSVCHDSGHWHQAVSW